MLQLIKKLWVLPVDIRLAANASKLRFRPRAYSFAGNVPLLDIIDKPIADWDVVLKWLFDKTVGTLALVGASPADGARCACRSSSTATVRCCSARSATASTTS